MNDGSQTQVISSSTPFINATDTHRYKQNREPLWEWSARIRCNKHELGSSFSVCLFLGPPPDDPEEWLTAPNLAGAHHVFVAGGGEYGQRRGPSRMTNEGFVNLNSAIARISRLNTFDPEVVVPYLKDYLQWRVQTVCVFALEIQALGFMCDLCVGVPDRYDANGAAIFGGCRLRHAINIPSGWNVSSSRRSSSI
uniref:Tyrosinase C-terminal domain-containing protein n=1 Tax=Psilocybe cubensis TaxID=181762 RepID=A0A8H7XJW9_PSICU